MWEKRCPWCGKKIERFPEGTEATRNRRYTPRLLTFSYCPCCDHYYGQSVCTKRGIICSVGLSLCLLMSFLLKNGLFLLPTLVFSGVISTSPLLKMTEQEDLVFEEEPITQCVQYEGACMVEPHEYYFLMKKFDEMPAFSGVAPLYIYFVDEKKKQIFFSFLYEHPQNAEYMNSDKVPLYDSDGKVVADIKFGL